MAIKQYTIADAKRDIEEMQHKLDAILIRANAMVDDMQHHNDIAAAVLAIGHKIIKTELKRQKDAK